jgi:hypothetical protein
MNANELKCLKVCIFIIWTVFCGFGAFNLGYLAYPKIQDMTAQRDYAEELASQGKEDPECETRLQLAIYDQTCASASSVFAEAYNVHRSKHPHINCTVWLGTFYFWLISHDVASKEIALNTNHHHFVLQHVPRSTHFVERSKGDLVGTFEDHRAMQGSCSVCDSVKSIRPSTGLLSLFQEEQPRKDDPYIQFCCQLDDGIPSSFTFKWRQYSDCDEASSQASLLLH